MAAVVPRMFHALAFAALFLLQCAAAGAAPAVDLQTASSGMWRDVEQRSVAATGERVTVPQRYRLVALDLVVFNETFALAPMEFSAAARQIALVVTLPMPDGSTGRFQIQETQLMAPELAAKFPEIRTWTGQGIDDPSATARLDWTPQGFHAMVLSTTNGRAFIDPYSRGDTTNYMSYYTRDQAPPDRSGFTMYPPIDPGGRMAAEIQRLSQVTVNRSSGTQLRTYRLAVAATKEYTNYHGGTVLLGQAAIVTAVNRVVGVYEVEVAVRMQLVANNNLLVYTNGNSGPYTNDDGFAMLDENIVNLTTVLGLANFDIGHVFSTGGGGVAYLGVPCTANKAGGVTGSSIPTGDAFWIDYVAHEMGHQFGGNHTFNSVAGNCGGGNREATAAYEPGSGSTIMAYAGICGADDLQPNSDPYFHTKSFDEIVTYTTVGLGNACAVTTPTGNTLPVVTMPTGGFTIPANTPFALTGSATDADGDALTHNWEEFDLGSAGAPGRPTFAPFFRSWNATTSPTRTFPRLSNLLANTLATGEVLPNVTRALNFRMTVRDNRTAGGGVVYSAVPFTFNVTTAAGPFVVTAPNTNVTWAPGAQTVTWNVASTTAAPVNCANVDILLSTDGGNTFATTLLAGTPNDGTQSVTLPNVNTTTARIKVACSSNVFFNISNVNFTIGANPGPVVVTGAATSLGQTGATLNGTVSSNGATTTVTFNYGMTTGYGSTVTAAQSPLASGAANTPVSAAITGLVCNTLYHFQAVGANGLGTTNGNDLSFTTAACSILAKTKTRLSSDNSRSTVGDLVTFTASVSGTAPTGTVAFKDGGVNIAGCAAVATSGSGNTRTAACSTSSLTQGTHTIVATYSGDAGNSPSTSRSLSQRVRQPRH